jgi:hypothetical protein
LNSKTNEFFLELGVLTKNATVMLLIVLAEAALRRNFVFWFYFVVIKANNFFTNFWHSRDKSNFLPILQKMQKYNNNLREKCLSV